MANETSVHSLLASATHGATALGVITRINGMQVSDYLTITGEGVTGPTARGIIRRDSRVSLGFLVGPPIADSATKASLVVTVKRLDGSTVRTLTWTNMKAGSAGYDFERDSPPAAWNQEFLHEGDLSSSNFSEA